MLRILLRLRSGAHLLVRPLEAVLLALPARSRLSPLAPGGHHRAYRKWQNRHPKSGSIRLWEDCGVTQPTPPVLSGCVGVRLLVE